MSVFEFWMVLSIIVVAPSSLLGRLSSGDNCGHSVELRRGKVERIEPPRDPNGDYKRNLQCDWRIQSQTRAFWVTFDRIDVESEDRERSRHWHEYNRGGAQACKYDYVKIEFMSWTDEIHKTMCGASEGPRQFLIHSNEASIYFKTDAGSAGYGFQATITSCQDMTTITDGTVNIVGDTGHVSCNPPYILDPTRAASYNCSDLPESSKMPKCILPIQCASFPIANGIWPGGFEGYQNNSVVSISCEYSYRLDGQGQMTCRDGRWISHSYPRCLPTSCESYPVANGNVTVNSANNRSILTGQHDENTTATIACNKGYHLVGADTITCQNRQWLPTNDESSLPVCLSRSRLATVCSPYNIDNGHLIPHNTSSHRTPGKYSAGDELAVVCNAGYILDEKRQNQNQLSSTNASIICEKTGEWTYYNSSGIKSIDGMAPRCVLFGCPPPHIANSNVSGHFDGPNGYHVSVQPVGVVCNPGYQLRGNHQIKCNQYTQKWASDSSSDSSGPDWQQDFPVCIPDRCADLDVGHARIRFPRLEDELTEYDRMKPRKHSHGVHAANVTAEVTCQGDFELIGARLLVCADGKWMPVDGGGHASSICARRSHKHKVWITLFAVFCALAVVALVGFVVYKRVLRNNQRLPDRLRLSTTTNEPFHQLQDEL